MFDFSTFLTDNYAIALSAALLATLVIMSLYYGLYHYRTGRWHLKSQPKEGSGTLAKDELPPVSVVLTAHNDAVWLKENLGRSSRIEKWIRENH